MATVMEPVARAPERIRHPLQAVRATIRKYVLLEGAALAVTFLALWFWIALALDWGIFAIFSYDWVLELQNLDESKNAAFYLRLVLLLALAGCLAALAVSKMVMRLTREFSDAAVALVLERKFPKELGDRLITAVEMADPKLAASFGFSPPMLEQTIREAGDRVAQLPVGDVFDWSRLKKEWWRAAAATVGLLVVVGALTCGISAAVGGSGSPVAFAGGFSDVAAIWTERNLLLQDSYWPRQAYLEVVRFPDTPSHRGEMRTGRDEDRPNLIVRAVQWIVADKKAPDGWRALRWSDLPNYLDKTLLDRVAIPADYPGWTVDFDDLHVDISASVIPESWRGKTAGEVRREMQVQAMQTSLKLADADKAVEALLDWRNWTIDRIDQQEKLAEVRQPLREKHLEAHKALEDVFSKLEELAGSTSMSRRLRKLTIPSKVEIVYRGETTKITNTYDQQADQKYYIDLNEFKESGRFRVRGEDYWTRPLTLTLVPPPSVVAVTVDKEEPAYLYHRLQGKQAALKGKKQLFKDYSVSATGDSTTIDIPLGSNMTLHVKTDRSLKPNMGIRVPAAGGKETGSIVPTSPVTRAADGHGYQVRFDNIVKMMEFNIEYMDEDNVKGKRRFRIRPTDDQPPEIISPELAAVLRKPKFKTEPGKTGTGLSIDGYLITPDALIPFLGTLRDDYGLAKAEWLFETELVDIQLAGGGDPTKDRSGLVLSQGNARVRKSGLIASALQYHPASLAPPATIAYWTWVKHLFDASAKYQTSAGEESAAMDAFQRRLEERAIDEVPLAGLDRLLQEKPAGKSRFKEHLLKDEDGFDVRRHLARLKAKDSGKEGQQLYFLKLSIAATDNNIETGPSTSRTKSPFFFLVISENELLAQVAVEEEVLSERLEKVMQKLISARVSVNEQIAKLPSGGDLGLSAIRADDVRKTVLDSASVTREAHTDFVRILRELEVNRVRKDKITEIRDRIVNPLDDLINTTYGEFTATEEASQKFYQGLEDEIAAKRATPNIDQHLANAKQTRDQLEKLMAKLNDILIALDQGITLSRNYENLVLISRFQDEIARRWDRYHKDEIERILKGVLQPPGK